MSTDYTNGWQTPTDLGLGPVTPPYDWGWQSPSPVSWGPTEFDLGWQYPSSSEAIFITAALLGEADTWPDDGGEVVYLGADYGFLVQNAPFRIRLRHATTLALYPDVETGMPGCYGLVPSGGTDIYPDEATKTLIFNLPRVPPGVYDLVLSWGIAQQIVINKAFKVTRRTRSSQVWSIRQKLSRELRGLGPRHNASQPKVGA